MTIARLCGLTLAVSVLLTTRLTADETLWLEAEHFAGVRGYCWPMGKPEMKQTDGHWGLSGPGWAAEWCQGGESGFLSIATGGADDRAVATRPVEIPVEGRYALWVRYADRREMPERFEVRIEQPGRKPRVEKFGERAIVEEDNEMKLYFGWAFGWSGTEVELAAGPATVTLATTVKDPEPRQIDVVVLTTDLAYRPLIKERPTNHAWQILDEFRRRGIPHDLEPLARRRPDFSPGSPAGVPDLWKLSTFRDRGFLYLWNVSHTNPLETWLSDRPDRVKVPYNIADKNVREGFEKQYAGQDQVPIFSDPRLVPTFHGVGAGVFAEGPAGDVAPLGQKFAAWLDANPDRAWAMMMNYHGGAPIGEAGMALFQKYRDRYVGSISGESFGYFYPDAERMKQATAAATTRRQLVEAFTPLTLESNREKYRKVYGRDLDANPYQDVIACLSVGNIMAVPLCADWGARVIGYESSAATSSLLSMRWAFMRGAARQWGVLTGTYRSCNFGDSSTIFSDTQSYHAPRNIFDNYYSVFSGAGMTWYKMDIWYQYMAGASLFYHEQGFDEYWQPGGTTAAGLWDVQLSPKGKLVDRFLRVTAEQPERGTPYTPVAFLVDYAHGWEPAPFWPNAFKNWHGHQDRFLYGDHERMLQEYFWAAYHPIGRESERPITGTNEVYVPGVFGDMFDVILAYPDVAKWRSIDSYPVVIVTGDIELTAAEGERLQRYVQAGGTLLVADAQLTGPGAALLGMPTAGVAAVAEGYRWLGSADVFPSQHYQFNEIASNAADPAGSAWRSLATAPDGKCFCAAVDRGAGRLIYLAVPRGLGIDRNVHPVVTRLLAHLTRGLMPVEVEGDVQWLLNRTPDGWLVTLLNPAGQDKPQHGITPTDYRQNREIVVRSHLPIASARDRLMPDETLTVREGELRLTVPAGGVRILELK